MRDACVCTCHVVHMCMPCGTHACVHAMWCVCICACHVVRMYMYMCMPCGSCVYVHATSASAGAQWRFSLAALMEQLTPHPSPTPTPKKPCYPSNSTPALACPEAAVVQYYCPTLTQPQCRPPNGRCPLIES